MELSVRSVHLYYLPKHACKLRLLHLINSSFYHICSQLEVQSELADDKAQVVTVECDFLPKELVPAVPHVVRLCEPVHFSLVFTATEWVPESFHFVWTVIAGPAVIFIV